MFDLRPGAVICLTAKHFGVAGEQVGSAGRSIDATHALMIGSFRMIVAGQT